MSPPARTTVRAVKALVVLTQPPLPEGGAPGKCAVALLRGLQAHGVQVRALAARQHYAVSGEPPTDLPVEVIDVAPEPPGWATRLNRWRRPHGELGRGIFAERVREAAEEADVVHLEETETAWCDEGMRTPSVLHVHYLVRRDRSYGPPWRKQFREVLEYSAAERAAVRRHRHLVASSPLVLEALRRRAPGSDLVLAPLSLDPRYYEPAPLDGPPLVGIIGTAVWSPTSVAVMRLVTRVWPLVRRRAPEARLAVAGRGMGALPGLTPAPGVDLLGEVDSAAEFLRGVSVLLYPVERGSGMKVKVLEAIAAGVPVVTTPAGAEGIDAGEGVLVKTDDVDLAEATISILRDQAERKERGHIARAAYERLYTPVPATAPLVPLYERMADRTTVAAARRRTRLRGTSHRPYLNWLGIGSSAVELKGRIVVVSPHLDDAVFSLGSAIAHASGRGAHVRVVTVFAGDPDSSAPAAFWDQRAGFRVAGEAASVRRQEDRRACAIVGAEPLWLRFLASQYRHGTGVDLDHVWAELSAVAADADLVLFPGYPLIHPDHKALAQLAARRRLGSARISYYVEQPYAAQLSSPDGPATAPRGEWKTAAARLPDRVTKMRSCNAYASQVPLLGARVIHGIFRYEFSFGGEAVACDDSPSVLRGR